MTPTMYVYRAYTKAAPIEDLIDKKCDEFGTPDIDEVLRRMGFGSRLKLGDDEVCSLDVYTAIGNNEEKYKAFVLLSIGDNIETYAIPTGHDLTEFMKEYVPMLKDIMQIAGVSGSYSYT